MAELQFEAPLAKFDGEEWNEFHDFQTSADLENSNSQPYTNMTSDTKENSVVDNFSETFSGSLEDLVNTFDDKMNKCFCNYEESVEKLAPVQIRSQEEIMNDCQMWWTITGNFGNILPIDWSKTYARQLQEQALHLRDKREHDSPDLDLSDDEELTQAFDMHSLIISSLQQEPLFTADEVIQQIEGMMEDSPSPGSSPSDGFSMGSSDLHLREKVVTPGTPLEDKHPGLKTLSISALNELYEELECTIRDHSETLIHELALRDELEYEKELKNQFISLLLNVQKKRKETQCDKKKANSNHKRQKSTGTEPGTYLTTVIPYHPNQGPPNNNQLAIYIKILMAINDDSPTVPGLLTDYILKVLCPTT